MATGKVALSRTRHERIQRALSYETVDRVPVTFLGPAFAPFSQGMPLSRFCTDADAAIEVTLDCMDALGEVDGVNSMVSGLFPVHLANQWLSKVEVPGRSLPENSLWQVREEATMTVEDYQLLINEGIDAFLGYIGPKVHDSELLERHNQWNAENFADCPRRYHERGYATVTSMVTQIGFEVLCGARSMSEFYLDCYRIPDVVEAALQAMQDHFVQLAIDVTAACGVPSCWVGGWRSASAMVSPKIWDRLVFPFMLDMVNRLHEAGVFSVLHFDQNWDRDVHRFLALPRHSAAFAFDGTTDIRAAKEQIGDHLAFFGDVPAALLATGTPEQVRAYVRDLIRDLGPTGLVVNSGCDIPFNAPTGNVRAMVAATHEFGTSAVS